MSENDYCPMRPIKCIPNCALFDQKEKDCAINLQVKYSRMACILLGALSNVEVSEPMRSKIPDVGSKLPNESEESYDARKEILR